MGSWPNDLGAKLQPSTNWFDSSTSLQFMRTWQNDYASDFQSDLCGFNSRRSLQLSS